jgi:MFS family permease
VRSVAIWVASGAVAATFGPALGGVLVEASWRWIFLINIPVGVLGVLATARWIPQSRDASVSKLPDFVGAALLATSVGVLSLGLVKASDWGWRDGRTNIAWAVTALALAGFVAQSKRHASPVIAPRLLQVRSFVRSNVTVLVFGVSFGANLLAAMLWLQQVWGYSPLRTGLAITPGPLIVPLFTAIAQRLTARIPIGYIVGVGCVLLGAGSFLLAINLGATPAYASHFLPFWLTEAAGVGLALPAMVASATSDLPPTDAATGSGVVTMNQQIGMAVGVSVLVAVVGTPTTYVAVHADYQHLWWVLAAVAALAGASAARISPRRAVQLMP